MTGEAVTARAVEMHIEPGAALIAAAGRKGKCRQTPIHGASGRWIIVSRYGRGQLDAVSGTRYISG
jgi:hypothetical protein